MKGLIVELRQAGEPPLVMLPETYAALEDDDPLLDGPAHLVYTCDRCNVQHELGTWEEVAAVLFAGRRGGCPVDQARGGQ